MQYFIAVLPPEDVADMVQDIKKYFAEKYNSKEAYQRPAHFTLQPPFEIPETNEKIIIPPLVNFANDRQPFRVQLSGFNHFRDDVIYIDVKDPSPMKSLHLDLIEFLQNELDVTDRMIRSKSFTPHMTVAFRDLSSEQFRRAWAEFSSRSFDHSFKVKSTFLMKHENKRWQAIKEFAFDSR